MRGWRYSASQLSRPHPAVNCPSPVLEPAVAARAQQPTCCNTAAVQRGVQPGRRGQCSAVDISTKYIQIAVIVMLFTQQKTQSN